MGRQIHFYSIHFDKLQHIFDKDIERDTQTDKVSLKTWLGGDEPEERVNYQQLITKLQTNPYSIEPKELDKIIDWLEHYFNDEIYFRSASNLQICKRGVTRFFEIPTTSLSTTFIDIIEFFANKKLAYYLYS